VSIAGAVCVAALSGKLSVCIARALVERALPRPIETALPVVVGFAVLVSPPLLRQATRPEVYTVALALFTGASFAFVAFARGGARADAALRVGALLSGLSASLHPPHGLSALGVGLVLGLAFRRDVLRRPRALGWAALFYSVGFVPLVFLPIRAHAGAPMWGNPESFAGFWAYVSATAYRQNLQTTASLPLQILEVLRHVVYAAGLVPLFGLLAVARTSRRSPEAGRFALGILGAAAAAILGAFVTPIDPRIPDHIAYLGPACVLLIIVGAAGMATLRRLRYALVGVMGVSLSVFALRDAPAALDAEAPVLASLGQSLTTSPPPRSLVIVTGDFGASTWMMERAVADARPDVAFFVSGLASSSWHWRSLSTHPAFDGEPVAERGRDPFQRYTRGAIAIAAGQIPIAVEVDEWSGGLGTIRGPYLVGDPRHVAREGGGDGPTTFESELARAVARLARDGGPGDHGVVHDIYRAYEARRARRLVLRGRTRDGMESLERALVNPSELEIRALSRAHALLNPRLIVPVVAGDAGPGLGRPATVREAAVLLNAVGEEEAAIELLEAEAPDDPRAILQLAWIAWVRDRPDTAARALSAFEARAPGQLAEAAALAERLSQ
jgi:hypothetical protein